jgi:uncharacterized protein YjbJ (UPF0337 family)
LASNFVAFAGNISGSPWFFYQAGEPFMNKFREKAQGRTKQIVGQMIDHNQLVQEGKERERHAEQDTESASDRRDRASQQPHK